MWGLSLVQEDSLEEGMATHSIFLPGNLSWSEEPGGLQSLRPKESDRTEMISRATHYRTADTGEKLVLTLCPSVSQSRDKLWPICLK